MELSVKKINRAMESFIDKENYKYYPSHFGFDYEADKNYVYMLVESYYIIRVPRNIMPDILNVQKGSIRSELHLEDAIVKLTKMDLVDFYFDRFETTKDGKQLVVFKDNSGNEKRVQARFFKEFYNKLLTKNGFADNITFSGTTSANQPIIMWENDEAIAEFCPIVVR